MQVASISETSDNEQKSTLLPLPNVFLTLLNDFIRVKLIKLIAVSNNCILHFKQNICVVLIIN